MRPACFQSLVAAIDRGDPIATALVVATTGSTPGRMGWRAIIHPDGSIEGTLGGGAMEAAAQQAGAASLRDGRAALLEFAMDGPGGDGMEPICGGSMSILLDPDPARHRAAYVSAREAQRRRNHGILATRFGAAETEGISVTWVESGDAQDPVEASRPATSCFNEPVAPLPRLVIFGAGHVGQALARQASLLGVEIAVVDDRPEFCRPALFPPGARILCQNPDEAVRRLALDADTDVVLVGRGYRQDLEALACCVNAPVRYVGMIGSRRKVALVKRDLVASGRATAEALERVHAPIGLDIGAVTAAEIAVSIAAEWLAVVAGRRPCTRERA